MVTKMIALYRIIVWSVIAPIAFLATALFLQIDFAQAQNFPWCAIMDNDGTTQCNYSTLQQCLQNMSGIGGRCVENPAGGTPQSAQMPSSENAQGLLPLQLQNPGPPPGLDGGAMPPPPNN